MLNGPSPPGARASSLLLCEGTHVRVLPHPTPRPKSPLRGSPGDGHPSPLVFTGRRVKALSLQDLSLTRHSCISGHSCCYSGGWGGSKSRDTRVTSDDRLALVRVCPPLTTSTLAHWPRRTRTGVVPGASPPPGLPPQPPQGPPAPTDGQQPLPLRPAPGTTLPRASGTVTQRAA